jgi:anti-sigma B factor antagonist
MGAEGKVAVVALEGEFDLSSVGDAEKRIAAAEQDQPDQLVIDVSRVTFMDSSGLRVLLAAHHRAQEQGWDFALVRGSEAVERLLEVAGLAGRLPLVDGPPGDAPADAPSD